MSERYLFHDLKAFLQIQNLFRHCLILFGVSVSCRILYSIVGNLYVSCSGSVTSVGSESANWSAIVYLLLRGFRSERFLLVLGIGRVIYFDSPWVFHIITLF